MASTGHLSHLSSTSTIPEPTGIVNPSLLRRRSTGGSPEAAKRLVHRTPSCVHAINLLGPFSAPPQRASSRCFDVPVKGALVVFKCGDKNVLYFLHILFLYLFLHFIRGHKPCFIFLQKHLSHYGTNFLSSLTRNLVSYGWENFTIWHARHYVLRSKSCVNSIDQKGTYYYEVFWSLSTTTSYYYY